MQFQFSGSPQKRGFGCACVLCLPQPQRFRQPKACPHSSRARLAFSLRGERPRQPGAWAVSPRVRRAIPLHGERPGEARGLCGLSPGAVHLFPCRRSGLRKSLDRNQGPVCRVGGGGFSGAEFVPFPSPLLPTSSRDGPALLCSFSVPLFCVPPAVCVLYTLKLAKKVDHILCSYHTKILIVIKNDRENFWR